MCWDIFSFKNGLTTYKSLTNWATLEGSLIIEEENKIIKRAKCVLDDLCMQLDLDFVVN